MRAKRSRPSDVPLSPEIPVARFEALWDVKDMASFLKKTPAAVYKAVERRELPYLKLRQAVRFDPIAVRAWLDRHAVPPDPTRRGR